ncbi:MAG: homogentisate 1,2-dioxygenase [Myxococcales bacterium]|nr:homogentisate 1,2-dioxygenase [Myxococcales bacterium]
MIERLVQGTVPRKHHIQLKDAAGHLHWEHCITQDGFEAPYTITYHRHAPHRQSPMPTTHGFAGPRTAAPMDGLLKRHFLSQSLPASMKSPLDARLPMLFNADITLSVLKPGADDAVYFTNADGDDLFYVHEGGGTLRTLLGDLDFGPGDYVFVPRGILHRFTLTPGLAQWWLSIECRGGAHLPKQWRNGVGQLRMDAPYCHRDFKKPTFRGPLDEGLREQVVKRGDAFYGFSTKESPLDVVGYDGTVYPWVFHILDFQPRVGLTHLPPTWHGTFAARGALVCSFVPRPTDFHPEAIPCPYPHSSVDVDEFIFYCKGNFTSRRGVSPGSMSYHPAGIPHGPHPGAYEASIGHKETTEMAVMLDCLLPLQKTAAASSIEDAKYHASFLP